MTREALIRDVMETIVVGKAAVRPLTVEEYKDMMKLDETKHLLSQYNFEGTGNLRSAAETIVNRFELTPRLSTLKDLENPEEQKLVPPVVKKGKDGKKTEDKPAVSDEGDEQGGGSFPQE